MDPPLPPPEERRHIREAAGLTQQKLADVLFVSRYTIGRWERPAGYDGWDRLPGREPFGELRKDYAKVLRNLQRKTAGGGQ